MSCVAYSKSAGRENYVQARTMPESGVIGSCCSLMVTVPLEGLLHSSVKGSPAVTSKVDWPSGTRMALFFCAATTAAQRAATTVARKRMLDVVKQSTART